MGRTIGRRDPIFLGPHSMGRTYYKGTVRYLCGGPIIWGEPLSGGDPKTRSGMIPCGDTIPWGRMIKLGRTTTLWCPTMSSQPDTLCYMALPSLHGVTIVNLMLHGVTIVKWRNDTLEHAAMMDVQHEMRIYNPSGTTRTLDNPRSHYMMDMSTSGDSWCDVVKVIINIMKRCHGDDTNIRLNISAIFRYPYWGLLQALYSPEYSAW